MSGAISGRGYPRLDTFTQDLLNTGLLRGTGEHGPAGRPGPELFGFISIEPASANTDAKGTTSASKRRLTS